VLMEAGLSEAEAAALAARAREGVA
jgi:hypothetical protein